MTGTWVVVTIIGMMVGVHPVMKGDDCREAMATIVKAAPSARSACVLVPDPPVPNSNDQSP